MNAAPDWALTIAYSLHMLATVLWIGSIAAIALLIVPAARRSMDAEMYSEFLGRLQPRLQGIGWFSLLVLAGTGMFQMISHPAYEGFLAVESQWAIAILIKHLAIGLMVLVSIYSTWGLTPALRRMALLRAAGRTVNPANQTKLIAREDILLRINLFLAILVLVLTAWARSSG